MGYFYQDSVNSGLSHTATYQYDSLNRLVNAEATGNSTYDLPFSYTADGSDGRYGNMTCVINQNTSGNCPTYSFNQSNNQITNSGYSYDAAGDLTSDGTYTYQYDAEGRLATVNSGGFASLVYNAFGQVVSTSFPVYGGVKVDGAFSPEGRELGYYDGGSGAWYDEDTWAAGRMVAQLFPASYSGGFTQFLHANALGSDAQVSNQTGAVTYDIVYYPWGAVWAHLGQQGDSHFAGFQQDSAVPDAYPTPTRRYAHDLGRWMTPDPDNAGADPSNPQSWNAYAYALNNPTTLTDPTGTKVRVCVDVDSSGSQEICRNLSDEQYKQLYSDQNGKQGINLPGGKFPTGSITCGGQVCGTAKYFEQGLQNDVGADLVIGGGFGAAFSAGASALEAGTNAIGRMLGIGAEETTATVTTTVGTEGTATVDDILQGAQRTGDSSSTQFGKTGGLQRAESDFKALAGREEIRGPVRIKELPDGRRAVLRTDPSTWGDHPGPSIDIQPPSGGYAKIKIRY